MNGDIKQKIRSEGLNNIVDAVVSAIRVSVSGKSTALTLQTTEDLTQTCITCRHFDEENSKCKLFDATPPARIIAYACVEYDDDYIPF